MKTLTLTMALVAAFGRVSAGPQVGPRGQLAFGVADSAARVVRHLAPGLHLIVRGDAGGWEVSVFASDSTGGNLLYHSSEFHGPYPSQVDPWAEAAGYFGTGVRILPVRGHPWVVRVTCDSCRTIRHGATVTFIAGTLRVEWGPSDRSRRRELRRAFPRGHG